MKLEQQKFLFPIILIFCEIAQYLSNDMYLPALPTIVRDLATSQDLVQYTLAAWFLGSGAMHLILGPITDHYGRRIVLLTGIFFFVITSIACALANDIHVLLSARFLQGATTSAVIIAGYSTIHELYRGVRAAQIITIMTSVTVLAPALGPLTGALIESVSSWRVIFWVLSIWGAIAFPLLLKIMPETQLEKSPLHLSTILQSYKTILTNTQFLRFAGSFSFIIVGFFVWIVESPFIFIETHHKSGLYYGVAQLFVFGFFILGSQLSRLALNKFSAARLIQCGFVFAPIGAGAIFIAAHYTDNILLIIAGMCLYSLASTMVFGPLNRLTIESSKEPTGKKMAIFSTMVSLGGGIAGIGVTFFNDKTFSNLSVMILSCVIFSVIIYFSSSSEVTLER